MERFTKPLADLVPTGTSELQIRAVSPDRAGTAPATESAPRATGPGRDPSTGH